MQSRTSLDRRDAQPLARVESLRRLDADELHRLSVLVERVTEADGVRPVAAVRTHEAPDVRVDHLLVYVPGHAPERAGLAGYARLESAPGHRPVAELTVDPAVRRRGIGSLLLRHVTTAAGGPVELWAHGDLAAARGLAASQGLARSADLLQLRRVTAPAARPGSPRDDERYVHAEDAPTRRLHESSGYAPWEVVARYQALAGATGP